MKLLVVLLCLLSERYLIHSTSYQRFFWFSEYYKFLEKTFDKNSFFTNPWVNLIAILLPIIIPVALIYLLFHSVCFGLFGVFLSIALFLYCLGPQNAFYPVSDANLDTQGDISLGNYFAQVNRQLYSVIFWYIVAGPIVVLTYRLITLCREINAVSTVANLATDLMEWIPARISALLLLLVGNFQRGFLLFTRQFFSKPELNNQLIISCGLQAVRATDSTDVPLPVAETLVEHATIVFLVFIALITLAACI